jgi:hypothetical protein
LPSGGKFTLKRLSTCLQSLPCDGFSTILIGRQIGRQPLLDRAGVIEINHRRVRRRRYRDRSRCKDLDLRGTGRIHRDRAEQWAEDRDRKRVRPE